MKSLVASHDLGCPEVMNIQAFGLCVILVLPRRWCTTFTTRDTWVTARSISPGSIFYSCTLCTIIHWTEQQLQQIGLAQLLQEQSVRTQGLASPFWWLSSFARVLSCPSYHSDRNKTKNISCWNLSLKCVQTSLNYLKLDQRTSWNWENSKWGIWGILAWEWLVFSLKFVFCPAS